MATDPTPAVVHCGNQWRHGTAKTPPAVALVSLTDDGRGPLPRCQSCIDSIIAACERRGARSAVEIVALDGAHPTPSDHHDPDPDDDDVDA